MHLFAFLRSADPFARKTIALYVAVHGVLAFALLLALLGGSAFAEENAVSAPTTVYDFGPWLAAVLDLLAPAILGVISLMVMALMRSISSWLGLRIEADQRAALNQGLANGVNLALEKLKDRARDGIPIDLKSEAIAIIAGYAERSYPDAIKAFGIDKDRLAEIAETRLEGLLYDPSIPESELGVVSSRHVGAPI